MISKSARRPQLKLGILTSVKLQHWTFKEVGWFMAFCLIESTIIGNDMYASKVFFAESKENDENNQAYVYSYYYFMAERRYVLTIIYLFCVVFTSLHDFYSFGNLIGHYIDITELFEMG